MSSIKKSPLPKAYIIAKRPDVCCLDFFGATRRRCDKFNRKQDELAEREHRQLVEFKFRHQIAELQRKVEELSQQKDT